MAGILNILNNKIVIDGDSDVIEIGKVSATYVDIQNVLFATSEEMDIYVRAADGSDTNPGTSALPLATLQAAIGRIPFFVNHAVRIHVGPHSGSGYAIPSLPKHVLNANIWIIGDGGGGGTDGFTEILGSTAALAGSDSNLIKSSGLSATEFDGFGEYFARTIEILTGAAAGDRRTIRNNTATDIIPNTPFSAAISTGDTYRIVEPEVIFNLVPPYRPITLGLENTTPHSHEKDPCKKLNFVNCKFDSVAAIIIEIIDSVIAFYGVEFGKSVEFKGRNSTIVSGIESVVYPDLLVESIVTDLSVGSDTEWAGWGLYSRIISGSGIQVNHISYFGSANCRELSFSNSNDCYIYAGSLWGSKSLTAGTYSVVKIMGLSKQILIGGNTTTDGILANHFAYVYIAAGLVDTVYVKGTNVAIRSRNSSGIVIDNYVTDGLTIESSGVGMQIEWNSRIWIPATVIPTMICGGNDFSEDYGQTVNPISDLVLPSEFSNISHGIIARKY